MCFNLKKVLFLNSKINISIQFWPRWYLLDIYLSSGLTACPLLLEDKIDSSSARCSFSYQITAGLPNSAFQRLKRMRYSLRLDMLCTDVYNMYINTSKKKSYYIKDSVLTGKDCIRVFLTLVCRQGASPQTCQLHLEHTQVGFTNSR